MASQTHFIEFSKPFIDAAKNVYETMIFSKLEPQKPVLKSDNISRGDVSAVLGLTGIIIRDEKKIPYKGMLVLSWPYETYFKIASAMLMETFTSYSPEIADLGGEISNMIMGNAKRELSQMGYSTNMAIPSIIEGKDHTIKYPLGTTIIMMPMSSAHGPMFMELCYRED